MDCMTNLGLSRCDQFQSPLAKLNNLHHNSPPQSSPDTLSTVVVTDEVFGPDNGGLCIDSEPKLPLAKHKELDHQAACESNRLELQGPVQIYGHGSLHLPDGGSSLPGPFHCTEWSGNINEPQSIRERRNPYFRYHREQGFGEQPSGEHACHHAFDPFHPNLLVPASGETYIPPLYSKQPSGMSGSWEPAIDGGCVVLGQNPAIDPPSLIIFESSASHGQPGHAFFSHEKPQMEENNAYISEKDHVESSSTDTRDQTHSECLISSLNDSQHGSSIKSAAASARQELLKDSKSRGKTAAKETALPLPHRSREFEDSRRKRIRERNLAAARKHRSRRIEMVSSYVQQEQDLRELNQVLVDEWSLLKAETHQLTLQILTHGGCGDPLIDYFIKEKAAKFTLG